MKTIQSEALRLNFEEVLKQIMKELANARLFEGKISIERVVPPAGTPTSTPAGFPHMLIKLTQPKKSLI